VGGRYELSFTDLDEGIQYWYRITALDPRPPAQKDPPRITVVGGSATLKRTATVSFDRLRVWMDGDRGSPGEMQFWAGFLPVGTPVALPTSSLFLESTSHDIAELRQSFRLADTEGTQESPFEIFSALGKLTSSLRGKITSTVVHLLGDVGLQRSAVPSTGAKRAATGLLDARPIFVTAGKTLVTFTLDPDGHIYRRKTRAR
jgi:hypothetical protein